MHIECRRRFQKSYGNTYHACTIALADSRIRTGKHYGYDSQCLCTALDTLREHGHDIPKDVNATIWLRDNGHTYSIVDVKRERDL